MKGRAWAALVGLGAVLVLGCDGGDPSSPAVTGDEGSDPAVGLRLYREGIRPGGEPLTAIVTGDVPVLGTQFSCQSCHGRSGMGASEGEYVVPAIAGRLLFVPSPQPERPAYDRDSLARALRDGLDAAGRPLDPLMPRYRLSDDEVAALAAYLATLSPGASPGVDEKRIRLATVVTDDVPPEVRDAVLAVLTTYVDEKNRQTRLESRRHDRGSTPASRLPPIFREWALDVWTLTGPPEGWREQLETRYRGAPVFALLSGVTRSWGPIGRFCESHEIPCLLPVTDLPEAEPGDFYSLHFSRGLDLEADLIAAHLASHPAPTVLQVFCEAAPARAGDTLRSALAREGVQVEDLAFACADSPPVEGLASRMAAARGGAAVLWLRGDQLGPFEGVPLPGRVYLSSTLVGELDAPRVASSEQAFVAHPFRRPGESDPALTRFVLWARTRGVAIRYPRLQAEAFFACLAANDALSHLGRYFVRDYALDMLDHAQGLAAYVPIHPRPTLGPGQRFLTKGGYVLPVRDGQRDVEDAEWILP